jgi:hypothetical protein
MPGAANVILDQGDRVLLIGMVTASSTGSFPAVAASHAIWRR